MIYKSRDQALSESDRNRIDYIALHHLPNDCPDNYVPVRIHEDGNCFPRTCSYLACQHEDMYHEFCVQIIYELVLNYNKYTDNEYMSRGTSVIHKRGTTVEQIAMFAESYIPNTPVNVEKEFKTGVRGLCKDGTYMGLWQICAAANIFKHPINSVYPNVHRCVRPNLNRKVWCIDECNNRNAILQIMWMPMAVNSEDPCHFVLLLKVVRKYCTYDVRITYAVRNDLQMFVIFSSFFYF